jgi:negative regulator of flagellin synthesis FlgM
VKIESTPLAANLVHESNSKAKRADNSASTAGPSVITNFKDLSSGSDEINMDKVNEIRTAISEGRLQINPERIAAALIQSSREFI